MPTYNTENISSSLPARGESDDFVPLNRGMGSENKILHRIANVVPTASLHSESESNFFGDYPFTHTLATSHIPNLLSKTTITIISSFYNAIVVIH